MTDRHNQPRADILDPAAKTFYCRTIGAFEQAGIETLIGGAYAFARYTKIERHTKDLDVFVRESDFADALRALEKAGYKTAVPFPHWLGKAYCDDYFVDVIYGSGNGVARVDDEWFANAVPDAVFDLDVRLCPVEEMIWSKAFIQERERYDGADIAHLLLARAEKLDWQRLLRRFAGDWRVLLSHLVLFGFIYPGERDRLPHWVMQELIGRLEGSMSASAPGDRVCHGTLLSRQQYLIDVKRWDRLDARTLADNPMTDEDIARWTAGIAKDGSKET
jgi:hypothetical protein